MTQTNEAKIQCDGCGKQYRWKPELAGRRVKCACGHVMQVPVEPPAPEGDLYDVTESATAPQSAACPSCGVAMTAGAVICVDCGYDTRTGARLGAQTPTARATAPKAASDSGDGAGSPPWVYRRKGLTAEEKVERTSSPLLDFVIPLILIPIGIVLCFYAEMHRKDQVASAAHVAPVVISGMITSVGLMLGGMFLAAAMAGVAFPDKVPITILKICAVALAPGAVAAIVDPMIGGINGNIVGNLAAVGLYWGLFALLFRLPAQDTVVCVMIVWIIRVAVAYGMYKLDEFRGSSWI